MDIDLVCWIIGDKAMQSFPTDARLFGRTHVTARSASNDRTCALQAEVLALFDELRDRLLRYAMSFGLSFHDGEDILQEVFLALFRHLELDRPRDNLPGWVYRTTHNLALKRRSALHMELGRTTSAADSGGTAYDLLANCADENPNPEKQMLFLEQQQRLRAVLHALPENDQLCLQLRAEGCPYREIASVVGISLGSVAASLARSFERLRRTDSR